MDVVHRLNELRLERNMSVYRLAELSGINQSTLANSFSRGTVPSVANLQKICETLGISMAQFFTENEEPVLLAPDEVLLIKNYRRLPETIKKAVGEIVNTTPNL